MGATLQEHLWKLLLLANYLLVILISVTILLRNRNPARTLSYIFALAAFPFLGLLVYYFFGRDLRKDKIFERKYLTDNTKLKAWRERFGMSFEQQKTFRESVGPGLFKVYELLHHNQRSVLTFHNRVDLLLNGEEKYRRLCDDLGHARHHIHMEYFGICDDTTGMRILEVLCRKAREGVIVRLAYDDVGSSLSAATKRALSASGVHHFPFMPVLFSQFAGKFNYRDHRKIVVIDGHIGYVGGINIRDRYDNTRPNERYWRDTHLRIEGPAAGSLQASFLLTWDFVSDDITSIEKELFPQRKPVTDDPVAVQIAASGPDTDWANIMEALFTAINNAREYVYITTPYMIPDAPILTALTTAARSGVDVRIIIPYRSDSWPAQYATDSFIEQLLLSGVRIYRYTKGFIHAKTLVTDDALASVGTANLDYRSFSINFEINALLFSPEKAKALKETFFQDLSDSEEVELVRWQQRSLFRRLQESVNHLWAPLL